MFTLLPLLVLRELGLGPQGMGIIMSVGAAGGLLGAVSAPWLARRIGEGTVITAGSLLNSLFLGLVPVAAVQTDPAVSLVLLTVSEFGFAYGVLVYNIMQLTMRQRVCPPRLLGRMNAFIRFMVWGVMPLAALAAGYLGGHWGWYRRCGWGWRGVCCPRCRWCSRPCRACASSRTVWRQGSVRRGADAAGEACR